MGDKTSPIRTAYLLICNCLVMGYERASVMSNSLSVIAYMIHTATLLLATSTMR